MNKWNYLEKWVIFRQALMLLPLGSRNIMPSPQKHHEGPFMVTSLSLPWEIIVVLIFIVTPLLAFTVLPPSYTLLKIYFHFACFHTLFLSAILLAQSYLLFILLTKPQYFIHPTGYERLEYCQCGALRTMLIIWLMCIWVHTGMNFSRVRTPAWNWEAIGYK